MGTANVDAYGKGSNWLWSTWVQLMLMYMVKGLTGCGLHGYS